MKKFHFVYITTNLINGKQYIGDHSTNDINKTYFGSGIYIMNAIKEYGKENFQREILEFFPSKHKAFKAQEKYIRLYETHISQGGYNISWKGGHQCKNSISKETIEKMKKPKSEEHKKHIKEGMIGRKYTEERIKNIKNSLIETWKDPIKRKEKSEKMKSLGFKLSCETKEKISKALKNKPQNKIKCPHCGKIGGVTMYRWHFNNCKLINI